VSRRPLRTKRRAAQAISSRTTLPAPYLGLNARDPESLMKPGWATVLENFFPTGTDVQLRKGAADHVTGFVSPVKTLMDWTGLTGSSSSKLFAACDDGIFDATTAGAVGVAVSVITEGWCNYCQFKTSGASFLIVVNGTDDLRTYNGAAWSTTATYTIGAGPATVATNTLIQVAAHQRRLWLLPEDSHTAYYMAVDVVAGPVTAFPIGGYLTRGGHLVAMGTWTIDGGAGPDDYLAFVSSKGQVVVYAGTDPNDATKWRLVGVYDLPEPLGYRCLLKFGGDLLISTRGGVFPLTQIIQGREITSDLTLSDNISPLLSAAAFTHGGKRGWQLEHLLDEKLLVLNIPTAEESTSYQYVMNTTTKGWAKFTGWNGMCLERHKNSLYLGMTDKVAKVWTGVQDFGGVITGLARSHFDYFGDRGRLKDCKGILPIIKTIGSVAIGVALDTDYDLDTTFGGASFTPVQADVWDTAEWDSGMWASSFNVLHELLSPAAYPFHCAALRLRVISGDATVAWSATDFIYEPGAVFG
jgi:hypothetical protein